MKTRTMTVRGDQIRLVTEYTDQGPRWFLVIEDYADARVVRRVRLPLYGLNARSVLEVLKEWKAEVVKETEGVP